MQLLIFFFIVSWFAGCTSHYSSPVVPYVDNTEFIPSGITYAISQGKALRAVEKSIQGRSWTIDEASSHRPDQLAVILPSCEGSPQRAQVALEKIAEAETKVTFSYRETSWPPSLQREKDQQFYTELSYTLSNGLVDSPEEKAAKKAAETARPVSRDIIVTTGSLSQRYEALGEVHANTRGMINLGSILNDSLFRSRLAVAAGGQTPTANEEQMNGLLKQQAASQYGSKVKAVINVTYRVEHDGDVYASGLAVQFIEEKKEEPKLEPAHPSLETRLRELKDLREKNLITPEEYYEKRSDLLKEL